MGAIFEGVKTALLDEEGGYSNNSNDRGGETKWGVSKNSYPDLDIKNLTFEDACNKVYIPDYWRAYRLSEIGSQLIANKIFLALINMPPQNAIKCVQLAINRITMNESIVVDGKMGDRTIRSLNNILTGLFLDRFRIELVYYYLAIVNNDKSQSEFLIGWLNRALS